MRLAQGLYEGVAIGAEGTVGLITYMRTDATHLAQDAVAEIRQVIAQRYGKQALPEQAGARLRFVGTFPFDDASEVLTAALDERVAAAVVVGFAIAR